MSLELLAKYYKSQIQEYEKKNDSEIINEPEEEITVTKNPFVTIYNIFNDAIPMVESDNFFAISYLGSQGKGKSFSASTLATLAKERNFLVIYAKAEDILPDKDAWVEQVKEKILESGTIYVCFVLDDMSYSANTMAAKKQAAFKHFIADIRHVFEKVLGKIKILMIYISHRLHSLPPMLRNSGTWIFASFLPEDRADALKLIPKQKEERERLESIYKFLQRMSNEGPKKESVTYFLGESKLSFKWGKEEDPGDGRLMMIYHAGEMKIFQSTLVPNMIDLESTRLIAQPKEDKIPEVNLEELKSKAESLFKVEDKKVPDPIETLKQEEAKKLGDYLENH